MTKPHVICHMQSSVDGRIKLKRWSRIDTDADVHGPYERIHDALAGDAWLCGRVTMSGYAMGDPPPAYPGPAIPREDFVARPEAESFAIGIDAHGKMNWGERNDITGDHVVVVLTEQVGDAHLAALRRAGVSYLFGGKEAIDLALVLDKLATKLGIKRLLVEGGGRINGSLLQAGLIDELSLLLSPVVDGLIGMPSVFDYEGSEDDGAVKDLQLTLTSAERLEGGVMWLRYGIARA